MWDLYTYKKFLNIISYSELFLYFAPLYLRYYTFLQMIFSDGPRRQLEQNITASLEFLRKGLVSQATKSVRANEEHYG